MQNANLQPIDDPRSFYQGLCHTNIDYYFKKDRQGLQSERPVVCAACLVVLEENPAYLTASQRTLKDGMLKVLDLGKDDYCVAWMTPTTRLPQGEPDPLPLSLLKYAPYSVLFLGSAFKDHMIPALVLPAHAGIPCLYTYSPKELEADPRLKRSAFDTLLRLKKQLTPVNA
ncbi:MAG: hypothetical protein KBD23_05980 [Gammaproteobacteria bacterium]|nr:hypothetical protein [Gammaproteobacteria bacterium]MBP9729663.1 hypothetical protein [Gammaproteobacteria bacterium]